MHCPSCLDGSSFPLPHFTKNWYLRRGVSLDKAFFGHHLMNGFLSGRKDVYCLWEYEGVSKTGRGSLCDDNNQYLLQLQILLSLFTKLGHVANVDDLTQR